MATITRERLRLAPCWRVYIWFRANYDATAYIWLSLGLRGLRADEDAHTMWILMRLPKVLVAMIARFMPRPVVRISAVKMPIDSIPCFWSVMSQFALFPSNYQPSGHINVSRVPEFYITYGSAKSE